MLRQGKGQLPVTNQVSYSAHTIQGSVLGYIFLAPSPTNGDFSASLQLLPGHRSLQDPNSRDGNWFTRDGQMQFTDVLLLAPAIFYNLMD